MGALARGGGCDPVMVRCPLPTGRSRHQTESAMSPRRSRFHADRPAALTTGRPRRPRPRLLVAVVAAGLVAAGCTDSQPSMASTAGEASSGLHHAPLPTTEDPARSAEVAAAVSGEPDPAPTDAVTDGTEAEVASTTDDGGAGEPGQRGRRGSGEPVTIVFGGDIHFEGFLATALAQDPLSMLDPVADMMATADLAVANLETAVTERGSPSAKAFNFRVGPEAFDALRAAGIDVVSLANNHGMDFGLVGLEDTLTAAADAEFPLVGAGLDAEEAYRPWSVVINGQHVAVIGATQVLDSSLISSWTATDDQPGLASAKEVDALVAAVAEARAAHDTVVVFLHWGIEGDLCPAARQIELADALIEAGADIIVGGHAHRVQGGGIKNGALVHYGLGNFVFYTEGGLGTRSGVLEVTITGRDIDDYRWIPARLQRGVATALAGDDAAAALDDWHDLRDCTDLDA